MRNFDARLTKQHLSTKIFKTYFKYLSKHYPDIDLESLCLRCGLPYSYFLDESNWVSVTFDQNFLNEIKQLVNDKDFEYKVGKFSISREGLGAALYAIGRNALSLSNIYHNSWKLSKYLNRVLKFEMISHKNGEVKLRVVPDSEHLDESELSILKKLMPDMLANTCGYYSSAPMLKGYESASIDLERVGDCEYIISVKYPIESSLFKKLLFGFAVSGTTFTTLSVLGLSWYISMLFVGIGLSLFASYVLYTENRKIRNLSEETQNALSKIDEQYKSLVDAKIHLQQKLREAEAINKITHHLIQTTSEDSILNSAAEDLTRILEYDRTLILLEDESTKTLKFRAGYTDDPELTKKLSFIQFEINIASDDPTKISNVFRFGRSILIEDVDSHIHTLNEESQQILRAAASKSFVCVAIKSEHKCLGVLLADTYKSKRKLSRGDVELLETVGNQIAIAIEKQSATNRAVEAYMELDQLAKSYSRFVPWETIRLLGYKSILNIDLDVGKELNMAVIFCDIRNFTTMSEKMSPAESISFLNSYFSNLAPIFQKNGGIIDKFLGDGIMALFTNVDDALRAIKEFQMQLSNYNLQNRSGGHRAFIKAGIGLHFGKVLFGTVGYKERLSISVVSDAVNLSSRLDGLTKKFGVDCVCTQEVIDQMSNDHSYRLIAHMKVDGRDTSHDIFEVFSHMDGETIQRRKLYQAELSELAKALSIGNESKARELYFSIAQFEDQDSVIAYYGKYLSNVEQIKAA